jgi:1-phosphofructokinase family hexose kinase
VPRLRHRGGGPYDTAKHHLSRALILAVTPNPALDITYEISCVRWHEPSNRVESAARRAGGKGINVARVLHQLGEETAIVGYLGGMTGAVARDELAASGLRDETVPLEAETRLTVFVVEASGEVTGLSEPGAAIEPDDWRALEERCAALLSDASLMTVCGSLPPGAPVDGVGRLIETARAAGVPGIIDTRDEWLRHGVEGAPAIVKINEEELEGYMPGAPLLDAASDMRARGAGAVVVSRGAAGLVAVSEQGTFEARPPERQHGNPTGAGDAATAAIAAGLKRGMPWTEVLREAVAVAAASVLHPLAGSFDAAAYRRMRGRVDLKQLS